MFVATYPSPLGTIVMESDGEVLTALRFGKEEFALRFGDSGNETAPHSIPTQAIAIFNETRRWLDEYFSGKRTENAVGGAERVRLVAGERQRRPARNALREAHRLQDFRPDPAAHGAQHLLRHPFAAREQG